MKGALRIIALPLTSETVATALGGLGITMMMLPFIYMMLAIHVKENLLAQIVVLAAYSSPIPLAIASISLWLGSGRKTYRDNSGARAMCELLSVLFLTAAIFALRYHTI